MIKMEVITSHYMSWDWVCHNCDDRLYKAHEQKYGKVTIERFSFMLCYNCFLPFTKKARLAFDPKITAFL